MAELTKLASPEVRGGAGLHPHEAGLQRGEEGMHLATSQLLLEHDRAVHGDRVHLEDMLGKIEADGCNLRHGWLLLVAMDIHHPGTRMP